MDYFNDRNLDSYSVLNLRAGVQPEQDQCAGLSGLVCEMVQRGCGRRDARQFVTDLERLGVDRSSSVSTSHTSFGGAALAENAVFF